MGVKPLAREGLRVPHTIFLSVQDVPQVVWEAARATGLLDTEPEEAFDRLTTLASRLARAPVALLTLLDEHRQFFKSQVGLGEPWASRRETPLTHSFCKHVARTEKPLIVKDSTRDPLVRDNLAIPDLGVASYCGVPVSLSDGTPVGALCVIDHEPRDWREELPDILSELAHSVMTELELRHQNQELAHALERQSQLLGAVAHDLRTPLTVIAGYSKLLLSPQLKFSPAGSTVRVRLATEGQRVRLTVSDDGPGIPPDDQRRIFEPFYTGRPRPTSGEKSTGLGLAIVQRIVEGHGGTIAVESEVNRGTTFTVLLA